MERPLIMLVDDDEFIREAFSEVLEGEGFHVEGYRNGREALEGLRSSERPCLILLDWMMPVMNGEEFLRKEISENLAHGAPVVVVSAIADRLKPGPGVCACVKKPLDIDALLETVRQFSDPSENYVQKAN